MSIFLVDGFDHNDRVDVWTSPGGGSTTTTGPRTGPRSYAFGVSDLIYRALQVGVEDDDGVTMGSAHYQESANAGSDGSMWQTMREDSVVHIEAGFWVPSRSIRIYRGPFGSGGGTLLAESVVNLWTYDAWHYLETQVKIADSGGTVEVRLNGATVLGFSGDTKNGGSTGKINRMGAASSFTGQVRRMDDVYLLNEQGSAPGNSFLGDTRCFPLYPNGNGNYSQLVGSDGNSTDNYLLVDEPGTPSSSDYVQSATAGDKDSYAFENMPVSVGTVRAVETRIYAAKSETGTRQMRPLIRRSGSDAFGADHVLAENNYSTWRDIFEQDPHAGPGTWSITNVDGSEFGVEVRN